MGWSGLQNGALLSRAAREFDAFVTLDHSMQHQQMLPPGLAILVLRLSNNKPETVLGVTTEILNALASAKPGEVVHVSAAH